ncbi:MAG: hydrogenase maturation nickel metallochaperone HypA [Anaerolineae bacterium]|nr:hydrogenase maturation nickel metallochaperone HypA [Anaerolineae bacterium]
MHELAITQNILEIVLKRAQEAEAKTITDIYLVIGQLSSIVDDAVQFYWGMIAQDTPAEQARLHFRRVPAEMACDACGTRFPLAEGLTGCPQCGSHQVRVVAGEEFFIESIDVDQAEGQ